MAEQGERNEINPTSTSNTLRGLHWPFRHGLQSVQRITTTPGLIREDLHQVFRGFRPLIDRANSSLGSTTERVAQSLPVSSPSNIGNLRSDFVINIDERVSTTSMPSAQNPAQNPTNNNNNIRPTSSSLRDIVSDNVTDATDLVRNSPELRTIVAFCEKYIYFILILLVKLIFDHRLGILILIGLFLTFLHGNSVVKREVGKQAKRQLSSLLIVTTNLVACIGFVYLVLVEENLFYALVMIPPYSTVVTVWEVVWIATVTDFVLKLVTVLLKIAVVAVPGNVLAFQKKGKLFLFLESSSQLYRSLVPMQHWLFFFSESYHGSSKVFGVILSAAYLVTKCKDIVQKLKSCKKSFISLLQSVSYGVIPTDDQLKSAGEACAICQDDYRFPTMLHCKHIFCEECVLLWFDRERTCPMCRAQIADDPSWRDGSTTFLVQIF